MKTFKLVALFKDEDYNFDYRYQKTVTLDKLIDLEEREIILDNIKGYFNAVMDEIADEMEGEQYGTDDEPNFGIELSDDNTTEVNTTRKVGA